MSLSSFFKTLWNAIRIVLAVIAIVLILIVAWEALLVLFGSGAVAYPWMGAYGQFFVAAGSWAAANGWLFAAMSLVVLQLLSPELVDVVFEALAEVIADTVDLALEVMDEVVDGGLSLIGWVALGALAFYLVKGGTHGAGRPALQSR